MDRNVSRGVSGRGRAVLFGVAILVSLTAPGTTWAYDFCKKFPSLWDKLPEVSDHSAEDWELRPAGGGSFDVFNRVSGKFVKYGQRNWGINLVWSATAPGGTITVERQGGGTVRFNDPVAIKVKDHGYLRYENRDYGIGLKWSSSPVYEWEVRGGKAAQPIASAAAVRLFNRTVPTPDGGNGGNMIYCRRTWGINLAWAHDCRDVSLATGNVSCLAPFGPRLRCDLGLDLGDVEKFKACLGKL